MQREMDRLHTCKKTGSEDKALKGETQRESSSAETAEDG